MIASILSFASIALQTPQPAVTLPNVTLLDMSGKEVQTSSLIGHKVILFNWASW